MDWETITGIATATIALCALFLSIWQGYQVRKHNKISVKPHLTTWVHRGQRDKKYSVEILNNGIGPAEIKAFTLFVDGNPMPGKGTEPIIHASKILLEGLLFNAAYAYVGNGYVMAEKERCKIIELTFPSPITSQTVERLEAAFNRAHIIIKYESMYGETFIYDSRNH